MSDVKWIKIVTDIFDDEKIKLIEALPSADSIIVIWFKLLCLAGQQNNSGVFMLNSKIAYTDEMLAAIFRRDVSTVRLAITTFQQYGMVEIIDDVLTIPNWSKYQTLDAYEKKKERDKLYQRERRERQKMMIEDKKTKKSSDTSSDNRSTVGRDCSYSISNSLYNNIYNSESNDKETDIETIKNIVAYLNKVCGTKYRHGTVSTQKHIRARLREGFTEDDFFTVIDAKYEKWGSDPKMAEYLRPETLFGTKFESYLNSADPQHRHEAQPEKEQQPFAGYQG